MTAATRTRANLAQFAAVATEARAAVRPQTSRAAVGNRLSESARTIPSGDGLRRGAGTTGRPPVVRVETRAGRVSSVLTPAEVRELDLIAFGALRRQERQQERAVRLSAVHDFATRMACLDRRREPGLIASLSAPGAAVAGWSGVIGAEGTLTGDGRLIEFGALTWATFPLPLRWAPVDWGRHDGAVMVGLIQAVERGDDGLIRASGVLDLGSEYGREAVRLIRLGLLGGISMDLDDVTTERRDVALADVDGGTVTTRAAVTSAARVRAATLVAIPAFENARITLDDDGMGELVELEAGHAEDCGCGDPEPGVFPGIESLPTIDDMPILDDLRTLVSMPTPFDPPTTHTDRKRV